MVASWTLANSSSGQPDVSASQLWFTVLYRPQLAAALRQALSAASFQQHTGELWGLGSAASALHHIDRVDTRLANLYQTVVPWQVGYQGLGRSARLPGCGLSCDKSCICSGAAYDYMVLARSASMDVQSTVQAAVLTPAVETPRNVSVGANESCLLVTWDVQDVFASTNIL